MDTQKIKAVLLAARYKSLSKAAEDFDYTPSAFSHSVASLEQELGVKLLDRSHTGVELSGEGSALLQKLQAVVDAENELLQAASAITRSRQNHLRLGTYASISVNLMPKLLGGFRELHPEIQVSVSVGSRLGRWLEEDVADVLICVPCEGYRWMPLIRDEFVAVVPEGAFPGKRVVSCEELYPYSFIETDNLLRTDGVDINRFRERIVVNAEDDMSAVSMVREGMGVTILPALALKNRKQGVRILRLKPGLHRMLGLCYREKLPADSPAIKFVEYARKIGADKNR